MFATDLTGTGYSAPSPPFTANHLAAQITAFLAAKGLTGADAAVLVGHSVGAAAAGIAALRDPRAVRGVVFLDGDATPLGGRSFLGRLLVNPYRTTLLGLAPSRWFTALATRRGELLAFADNLTARCAPRQSVPSDPAEGPAP